MKEITGINHYGLRVRDLTMSRAFYEKLGFEFIAGPLGPEPVAIMEHPAGINVNLILNLSEGAPSDNILMDSDLKYAGYIKRQKQEIQRLENIEKISVPGDFDFHAVSGLRYEAKEKLSAVRPVNLGQASRTPGVSPADISVLMIALK